MSELHDLLAAAAQATPNEGPSWSELVGRRRRRRRNRMAACVAVLVGVLGGALYTGQSTPTPTSSVYSVVYSVDTAPGSALAQSRASGAPEAQTLDECVRLPGASTLTEDGLVTVRVLGTTEQIAEVELCLRRAGLEPVVR